MVASLRHQKDPFTLIKAAELLGEGYRIVFVGEGELQQNAMEFAEARQVKNVTFLGKRLDVPSLMKGADVFVLSSLWDGFGLVVVEAAATGVPIVASDVSGLRDVVITLNGELFEKQNPNQLAKKIKQAQFSNVKFNNKYDIKYMVSQYVELYELEKRSGLY